MDLDDGEVARRVQPNRKVQLVGRHVRGHGARSGMGNPPRQEGYDAELPHAVEPVTGPGQQDTRQRASTSLLCVDLLT